MSLAIKCGASSLVVAALAPGLALAQSASAEAPGGASVSEILVTARKTSERLRDVPIAVTALTGQQLRENEHYRVEDLSQIVPNTTIGITNGRQSSFNLRGIGGNPGNEGLQSSVGLFLDGVYLARPGLLSNDLIDIEQIEVLRGPQGTLFGKNTTAGAINVTTALPSFDFGLRTQASFGNYGYQQYQASITGPITDRLAARLTAYDTTRDGDVNDVTTHKKVNDIGRRGLSGQLLYKPTDDLSIRIIGQYSREQQSTGAVPTYRLASATPAALQTKLDATGASIAFDPDGFTTAANGALRTGSRQAAGSAEINWNLGGFTLTSISAYRYWDYRSLADSDGSSASVIDAGANVKDDQWTQEVRLKFPRMGNVDALAGLYYFNDKIEANPVTQYGSDAASWLTGIPAASLPAVAATSAAVRTLLNFNNSRWDIIANPTTYSYAAFGQATWHITPEWNVTAGGRVTYETKHETVSRGIPVSTATGVAIAALASQAVAPVYARISDTAGSYLFSTDYHVTSNVMGYAQVSRGVKAGGLNSTLPVASIGADSLKVKPETATNYEIGLKAELADRRVALNLAAFRTDVADYQANYVSLVNGVATTLLQNVGMIRSQGVEAEATFVPMQGLSLHAFGAYDDAQYRSYPAAPCPVEVSGASCNLSGRQAAFAPKWNAGVNGSYEREISEGTSAYFNAEYSWRSMYYTSIDLSRYSRNSSYGLLNLRLGLRSLKGGWDIAAWGKNISNERYIIQAANLGSLVPGVYTTFFGDPATYGVTLRKNF